MRHLESSALCAVQPVSKPGYLFLGVCKDSWIQIGNVLKTNDLYIGVRQPIHVAFLM